MFHTKTRHRLSVDASGREVEVGQADEAVLLQNARQSPSWGKMRNGQPPFNGSWDIYPQAEPRPQRIRGDSFQVASKDQPSQCKTWFSQSKSGKGLSNWSVQNGISIIVTKDSSKTPGI